MASIAKETVRQQFDKIKSDFQNQIDAGKVPDHLVTLVTSLITLFEIVIAVLMEKQTKKTSKNSSLPPSQTEPDQSFSPQTIKKKINLLKSIILIVEPSPLLSKLWKLIIAITVTMTSPLNLPDQSNDEL